MLWAMNELVRMAHATFSFDLKVVCMQPKARAGMTEREQELACVRHFYLGPFRQERRKISSPLCCMFRLTAVFFKPGHYYFSGIG